MRPPCDAGQDGPTPKPLSPPSLGWCITYLPSQTSPAGSEVERRPPPPPALEATTSDVGSGHDEDVEHQGDAAPAWGLQPRPSSDKLHVDTYPGQWIHMVPSMCLGRRYSPPRRSETPYGLTRGRLPMDAQRSNDDRHHSRCTRMHSRINFKHVCSCAIPRDWCWRPSPGCQCVVAAGLGFDWRVSPCMGRGGEG